MRGTHRLFVRSARLQYEMVFSRSLTILQGDSGTGKSTLVEMLSEYFLNGQDTGISLRCDCPCRVVGGKISGRSSSPKSIKALYL